MLNPHVCERRPYHPHLLNSTTSLLADVPTGTRRLRSLGAVGMVECAERALATLIAGDRRPCVLCQPVGERHLAVAIDRETEFRRRCGR